MARRWYVGLVQDGQEWAAATSLYDMGADVHVSLRFERVQEGRKVKAEPYLRLPGYIFVALDPDPKLGEVDAASNAKGMDNLNGPALLRGAGGQPYALPAGTVETLRKIERDDFFRARSRSKPRPRTDLRPGDFVQVHNPGHPAHGSRGHYLGSDRGMARVLGGFMVFTLEDSFLKKIDAQPKLEAA